MPLDHEGSGRISDRRRPRIVNEQNYGYLKIFSLGGSSRTSKGTFSFASGQQQIKISLRQKSLLRP